MSFIIEGRHLYVGAFHTDLTSSLVIHGIDVVLGELGIEDIAKAHSYRLSDQKCFVIVTFGSEDDLLLFMLKHGVKVLPPYYGDWSVGYGGKEQEQLFCNQAREFGVDEWTYIDN